MRRRVKRHAIRNLVFALFQLASCGGMRMACVGPIAGLFARRDAPYVEKCRNANRPAIGTGLLDRWAIRRVGRKRNMRLCVIRRAIRATLLAPWFTWRALRD